METLKIKRIILPIALVALVAGCVVKPFKTDMGVMTKGLYRDSVTVDTTSIASINWHDFYSDPYLQQLIKQALDSNLSVRLAINRLSQASQYYKQSEAAFLPTLNLGLNGSLSNVSKYGNSAVPLTVPITDLNLGLTAGWELDVWGKLNSAKKAQLATMLQQKATVEATRTQLISNVASAYYQLVLLDKQKQVTMQSIENYTKYLLMVQSMKKSAQVNEVAVLQAKAQLASASVYLPQINLSIVTTENYLAELLGKAPSVIVRSDSIDLTLFHTEPLHIGIPVQMLRRRPDVLAAEYALRASHEQFNVATAAMYPQVSLTGTFGTDTKSIANWFNLPGSIFWSAVAGLTQPILNGRALRTQHEVAKLQEAAALLTFKQTLLDAGSEVSNALASMHYLQQQATYQKEQVDALKTAYNYSQELLMNGYATYLDVLNAQNNELAIELSLYNTYNNIIQQKITLYRALGGGWQ
jgi:NodT family efflux transporter outer membrane factor (OMF) lipoprotein